jgi:protease I
MGGAKLDVASSITGDIKGMDLNTVTATILVKDIKVDDYDAFIFISSQNILEYLNNQDVLRLIRQANEKKKILAAIEMAPAIFAHAGIVRGKNVASFLAQRAVLVDAGANWENNALDVDGNLITANDPQVSSRFGAAILDALRRQAE